jgi:hypothetical protein
VTILPDYDFGNTNAYSVDTHFSPPSDGFGIKNPGEGQCLGMSAFSVWYYYNEQEAGGALNSRFNDEAERSIAVASQNTIVEFIKELPVVSGVDAYQTRRIMENHVRNSGASIIFMRDSVGIIKWPYDHAVVVFGYAVDSNDNVDFRVYDPNSPGETKSIKYNDKTGKFDSYANIALGIGGYDTFALVGDEIFTREVTSAFRGMF